MSLLHTIRSNNSNKAIVALIQADVPLPPNCDLLLESESPWHESGHSSTSTHSNLRLDNMPLIPPCHVGPSYPDASPWFGTATDPEFIEHLMDLYFSWVHPFYQLFSRDLFFADFNLGKSEHCSALLANAIAAFACHYSDRPAALADPADPNSVGDHFFAEAKRLLNLHEHPSLTKVQALGIMSFREKSCGRDSNGYQYMGRCSRVALEMNLHISVIGTESRLLEHSARANTFWGVFNAET